MVTALYRRLPGDASYGDNWQTPPNRKRFRRHCRRKINGHKESILTVGVFVPCGLVPGGIKPFSYGPHRTGKLSSRYPDPDAGHDFPCPRFWDVNTLQSPTQNEKKLTKNGPDKGTKYKTAVRYLEALL